jgi:hypothetical protein
MCSTLTELGKPITRSSNYTVDKVTSKQLRSHPATQFIPYLQITSKQALVHLR